MNFLGEEEYVILRVNGGRLKNNEEAKIEISDGLSLKQVVKTANRKFGGNPNTIKVYNKSGVLLFEEDFNLIGANDILYIALNGENFNYCAILDDYDLGRTLGIGGFGKVVLGKHRVKRNQVAIKFTDVGNELSSANLISSIYKEAESLKALIHKHIVQLYHAFIEGKQFIMIMEAAMGGELLDYLKINKCMPEKTARHVILQVIQAMLYCHSRGVVHRDLKLENVLFRSQDYEEDNFTVKVVDFGIAGMADDKVDAGTLSYMAPECLEKVSAETTPAIDVWAIGIMFYAMVMGELPFGSRNEKELIKQIKNDPVKFNRDIPITEEGKETILAMLQKNPKERIELLEFVNQPYAQWEEEEFDKNFEIAQDKNRVLKAKRAEEEEEKLQADFLKSLDMKSEEKHNSSSHKEVKKKPGLKKKTTMRNN